MDTFTKQGLILVGVIVLALAALLAISSGNEQADEATLVGEQQLSTAILADTAEPESATARDISPDKWFAATRGPGVPDVLDLSAINAPKELEAKAIKIAPFKGALDVLVEFQSTRRCMAGDLDLLLDEVADNPQAPFLVSIEPLSGDAPDFSEGHKAEFHPREVSGGLRKTLTIPTTSGTRHLGLFVCRDEQRTGRCNNKQIANITQLLERRFDDPSVKATDRIYFFSYLLQENNTLTLPTAYVENEMLPAFEQYVSARDKDARFAAVNSQAEKLYREIQSLPPILRGTTIAIDLPRNDPGECRGVPNLTPAQIQSLREKAGPQ